jgi:hypothetical protein
MGRYCLYRRYLTSVCLPYLWMKVMLYDVFIGTTSTVIFLKLSLHGADMSTVRFQEIVPNPKLDSDDDDRDDDNDGGDGD